MSAVQRRIAESGDKFKLDELGLDKKFVTDPYTGKPLLTKKTDRGWIIYSVGPNGVDDGGAIEKN